MAEQGQSEPAGADLAGIRRELAILCRRSWSCELGWPRDWSPGSVVDPRDRDGQVFTERGAWEFIAELLEGGHPIEQITLVKPAGKKAYVLVTSGGSGRPDIYMKLEIGTGKVKGRSFHYSKEGN